MSKALLVYIPQNDDKNQIILESGSLFYIDSITKTYKNSNELKKHYSYKIDDDKQGAINTFYIRSNSLKEKIPTLYNDTKPVNIYDNFYEKVYSETERARKLLYNSKGKAFIKKFLDSSELSSTINFSVKLSYNEYVYARKNGIDAKISNEEYRVDTRDLFEFISTNSKLGILRGVFEDTLDIWKRKLISLDNEELYYVSRNLRLLINDYNKEIRNKEYKKVTNLKIYPSISKLINEDSKTNNYVKVIKDRNANANVV
ncbi:MAG: hypothetical protein SPI91_02035 [Bacilli bacterium]|nr:hypothetical protein [Bacilli bacterium]